MRAHPTKILSGILIAVYLSTTILSEVVRATPPQLNPLSFPASQHEPKRGINPETGKVSFIGAGEPINVHGVSDAKVLTVQERAMGMASVYGKEFGLKNPSQELKLLKSKKDNNGKDVVHYRQTYKDVPVLAAEMIVNTNANGELLSISGEVSPDLTLDSKPAIKAEEARETAITEIAAVHAIEAEELVTTEPELWIFDESLLKASSRPVELVWRMEVSAKDAIQPIREMVLVNAQTSAMSLHVNQVDAGLSENTSVDSDISSVSTKSDTIETVKLQQAALPLYFDLVVDETRGWIYGSDSAGNKIDVISTTTLQLIKSFILANGASPKSIALSPDRSELSIAQYGVSSILFINPDTGQTIATVVPNSYTNGKPWDLIYGRPGRLYSSGTSDYIHVIDTTTHSEIGRSTSTIGSTSGAPYLAISSTKDALFANSYADTLYKFDISTDNIPKPISTDQTLHDFAGSKFILLPDDTKIFTSGYQVWNSDLSLKIGGLTPSGTPAVLPNHNAVVIAVDNGSGSDTLEFVSTDTYYTTSTYTLPGAGTLGAVVANRDGTKLYVSSSNGLTAVDLTPSLPGTPVPLPSGPLPYYDLIIDEPRRVLYGSDWFGDKIDVISLSTLQVIKTFRLVNGAGPQGIALSPDGSELAVAQVDAAGLLFLDPDTGEILATMAGRPSDVIYGRTNRMYTLNADYMNGNHIEVIDTATHTRVSVAPGSSLFVKYLSISSDESTLFANGTDKLYKVDVSTDILAMPTGMTAASQIYSNKSIALVDDTKIFTDYSYVWSSDFKTQLGTIEPGGTLKRILASVPGRDIISVGTDNDYENDTVWFVDTNDFYTLSKYTLTTSGKLGPMIASADGSTLYVNNGDRVIALNLTPILPGVPATLPSGPLPYRDIVLDESRGVLYGSDFTGNKIDVISTTTLQVVNSFRLVNGARPKAIVLSPDAGELAIAQSGASSILFLNPDTGETITKLIPDTPGKIPTPADIIYGRPGRLYSTGNNYIHVIDSISHTEIGKSVPVSGFSLAISSDKNYLFTNAISKIDISTDTVSTIKSTSFGSTGANSILLVDDTKIFTDRQKVWNSDLSVMLGAINFPLGLPVNLPNHKAVAAGVDNTYGNDAITFVSTGDFYTLSTYTLPSPGTMGPLVATSDGSKLFVNTSDGFTVLDLTSSLPGTPVPLPSGPLPYFDVVEDAARGVLYGSDLTGNKIDVISEHTMQVVNSFRLPNGASPRGIALSSDGSELAIAQSGLYSLIFLNPDTGRTIATIPNLFSGNRPWDIVYGRQGRLYCAGDPYSYVHIIDTVSHTEINRFASATPGNPYLAVTSDKNNLFINGSYYGSYDISKFDISSDTPVRTANHYGIPADTFLLLADDSKIFASTGQVWSTDLITNLGSVGTRGKLAEIPSLGLVAVLSTATPGFITFARSRDYATVSTGFVPSVTSIGTSLASSTGDKVFVNTNNGIKALNIGVTDPSSISVNGGSFQAAQVSYPFADLLRAKVQNILGEPIPGMVVTFTAPSSGASGVFTDTNSSITMAITDSTGVATSAGLVANNTAGNYAVKATISALAASADFQLNNLASISCTVVSGSGSATLFEPYKQHTCNIETQYDAAVGIGDFNNDHKEDVALSIRVSTGSEPSLLIFAQDANGTLSQPRGYAGGKGAETMAVGDLNNDGLEDIVTADSFDNTISVFLQRMDGIFANRVTYTASEDPYAIDVGDVNNDGLQDVVVSHWNSAVIGVFAQRPDGTLTQMITHPSVDAGFDDIAIGDVNSDGLNDVVKMNGAGLSGNLLVYLQSDNNTLSPYLTYSLSNCTSFCTGSGIDIGDVTGDGRADVVMSYGGNISTANIAVFPQGANGALQSSVSYPAYDIPQPIEIVDVNSDTLKDVVTAHHDWLQAGVYLQRNNGTLGSETLYAIPSRNTADLDIGDVNNDGLPDVLITDDEGLVILYRRATLPSTTTPGPGSTRTPGPSATPGPSPTSVPPSFTGNRGTYTASGEWIWPGTFLCDQTQLICTNGADPDADKAHQYAADTFVFYNTHHKRNSFDNQGSTIISTAHLGVGYQNAFWDGYQMVYGDSMVADDVVGHEITHGVTQYTSNLIYAYQSGAINESFSDVWGEFIDQTNNSGNDLPSVKWLMGEDTPQGAIRNMSDPPAYGDPDKMSSPYYYNGDGDNGGVHFNSGVNNKAAYLMTEGGTFNGRTIVGIGLNKTAAVYYEAQVYHLTMGANYNDLYYALLQACQNLLGGADGITENDCEQVRLAAEAVEMVPTYPLPTVTATVATWWPSTPTATASKTATASPTRTATNIPTRVPTYDPTMIPAGGLLRASVDSGGEQGNHDSYFPAISADGRYIVFNSYASNLVSGDTNGAIDIFVHDMPTSLTTRVSVNSNGIQGNGHSYRPVVSADGRYIAFDSDGSNLVPGDNNGNSDVFVHDRQMGATTRVSIRSDGLEGYGTSVYPSISGDGRYIAFYSSAANLAANDTNLANDIFLHDRQTGETRRISAAFDGTQANSDSRMPSISADGRYIAFESEATNLIPGDTNGVLDVFRYDSLTGQILRVSVDSYERQANGHSGSPSISADGNFIAFESDATNLVSGDTNADKDIFLYDTSTGTTTRVSVDSNGLQANVSSYAPSISADGRYIAFDSGAENLVPGDNNRQIDAFVHDRELGKTTRFSVSSIYGEGNGHSDQIVVSADGQFLAFTSRATNLVPYDTNLGMDVFVYRQTILPLPLTPAPTSTITPSSTSTATAVGTPTRAPTIAPAFYARTTTGVFRPSNGLLYLKNTNDTGFADAALNYGLPGDYPVVGDWDGNGTATIGVYRNGKFYLRNSNTIGFADLIFAFGQIGDQPVAGDWDGDGIDTIGVYRPSNGLFLLRNSNSAGAEDMRFYLGNVGDVGIAGDWDGDGKDTTGVFRPSNGIIFLKNTNETGYADVALNYGIPGDKPVTGDWDADGIDTIGVYRNGQFLLRNSNTVGFAEIVFGLGIPGDMPIAGNWDGLP